MLAVFMVAITQALLRGLSLEDCGCFGDITSAVPALQYVLGGSTLGAADVLRDAVYAALALLVALGPATPLSIDGLLAAQRSASGSARCRRRKPATSATSGGKNPTRSGTGAEQATKPIPAKTSTSSIITPK